MQRRAGTALWIAAIAGFLSALAVLVALFGFFPGPMSIETGFVAATVVFTVVVGGVLFWLLIGIGAARAREAPTVRPHPDAAPQPVPDEAALSSLSIPIRACPRCGFLGIRPAGIQEGAWPGGGELARMTCRRCDYLGAPLEFERREDYAAFLAELQREPARGV